MDLASTTPDKLEKVTEKLQDVNRSPRSTKKSSAYIPRMKRTIFMQGISFEQDGNPYLSPITPIRPSWPFPDPKSHWMLYTASLLAIWTAWGLDIDDKAKRKAFLKKVRKLGKKSLEQGFALFVDNATRDEVSTFNAGLIEWRDWALGIQDHQKKADILSIVEFVANYARKHRLIYALTDTNETSKALPPIPAVKLENDEEQVTDVKYYQGVIDPAPGDIRCPPNLISRPSSKRNRDVDYEEIQSLPSKRSRCRSESPPRFRSRPLLNPKLLISLFSLSLNDVMYIRNLPGVRPDASFTKNRRLIEKGLLAISRQNHRLRRMLCDIAWRSQTESLKQRYEALLLDIHKRIKGPLARNVLRGKFSKSSPSRHPSFPPSRIGTETIPGPSSKTIREHTTSSLRALSQNPPNTSYDIAETEKYDLPAKEAAASSQAEYRTVYVTHDLKALINAVLERQMQNSPQRILGSIAEQLARLADKNSDLKTFNGAVSARNSSTAGQNQAYQALVTFLSAEVSTLSSSFLPRPNEEFLQKSTDLQRTELSLWYTNEKGGISKNLTTLTHASPTTAPIEQEFDDIEILRGRKIKSGQPLIFKTKKGHDPDCFGVGTHTFKSVTYEFRSLRSSLADRMDEKRRFENKVDKALMDPEADDQFRFGHYSIGGTTYVKIS